MSINSTFSYFTNKPQYSELHFSKTYTIVSYSHEEQPTGTECTSVLHKYPSMSVVLHHFSFTVVQKWKAVARWRHWGINSSFTKSAGHTKTAGSRPAGRHELSPCFLSCIEPTNVLLHIGFFLAFVKALIGHYPCGSCTPTKEHTLGFSNSLE